MDDEIQLISDGDGVAVIGEPGAVERFLTSEGLASRDLGLDRLGPLLGRGAGIAQAGTGIAANSGRWVQMTEESAELVKKYGLMKSKDTGLDMGVIFAKGEAHGIRGVVQFVRGPGAVLTNPAILAGAAGIMAQLAMQQTMDQITDYLAVIDEKVDDLLRAHKDSVLSDMIGVELVIEEAMTIRQEVGRVSEVTWSKVDGTSLTIARTQAYALRQLDALAEKIERKGGIGETAKAAREIRASILNWLAVLARCFQLQEALGVLELDRQFEEAPADLESHRRGLRAARANRLELISRSTEQLMRRMVDAAGVANTQVLLHPVASRTVVEAGNEVVGYVADFHDGLGIGRGGESVEVRRWAQAASDAFDKVLEAGADGVDAAKRGIGRIAEPFRPVDTDGDGVPEEPRALTAAKNAGSSIKDAGTAAAGAVGSLFRRREKDGAGAPEIVAPDPAAAEDESASEAPGE